MQRIGLRVLLADAVDESGSDHGRAEPGSSTVDGDSSPLDRWVAGSGTK